MEKPLLVTKGVGVDSDAEEFSGMAPLPSPMADFIPLITKTMDGLAARRRAGDTEPNKHVLEALRLASGAERIIKLTEEQGVWVPTAYSVAAGKEDGTALLGPDLIRILPMIAACPPFPSSHGMRRFYEDAAGRCKAIVVAPACTASKKEFVVVCGLPADSRLISDPYGLIISAIYLASKSPRTTDPHLLEARVLDELRRVCGFLPQEMYERRFQLFCEGLNRMTVHYQPILYLHPEIPYVTGWEALARDPETSGAPGDLFAAAELWGLRYKIQLDIHFLRLSTALYRGMLSKTQGGVMNILELSINVYPESLMTAAYFEAMRQLVVDKMLPPEKIVLEISEKSQIEQPGSNCDPEDSLKTFRKRLERYVEDFQIAFAIDDFGACHASTNCLNRLLPEYVKIDRDVLLQDYGQHTIRYVLDLLKKDTLRGSKVVVEGFDEKSRIPLDVLYNLGVRYVQGFTIGKASPDLNDLKPRHKKYLTQLIAGPGPRLKPLLPGHKKRGAAADTEAGMSLR